MSNRGVNILVMCCAMLGGGGVYTRDYKINNPSNIFFFCFTFSTYIYRTLHSYNLIWAVCHLFPQQRWQTHTYSVSGNHWPGELRDLLKPTSA